jgi:hypothetical protein
VKNKYLADNGHMSFKGRMEAFNGKYAINKEEK